MSALLFMLAWVATALIMGGISVWLAFKGLYQAEREITIHLFDLQLKFGTKISRPCSVCGVEVWLGIDGYDYNLTTYCGKHKPPQLKGYYNI